MSLLVNTMSIILILIGITAFSRSMKYRLNRVYFKLGPIKIPFWFCKTTASVFVIALAIFALKNNSL
ncbi:hypothetical protein GCM10011409_11910 [Lentibacillus populi]|uniref:Uncharacterized protein n=1 Tax=Lentibacillus populi TaxID=1827502 RepID=A0A9W5TVX8_9BACI|nr:hypothetical protein GCM10011409_11910 [Lentibacillus populi]